MQKILYNIFQKIRRDDNGNPDKTDNEIIVVGIEKEPQPSLYCNKDIRILKNKDDTGSHDLIIRKKDIILLDALNPILETSFGVIIVPTRELATHIDEQATRL
uniref:AAA_11 domain-containing protein n=1 Tax=Strongyloides papillosus TaxID=174720 RepID=A0A0N5BG33_STREA